jgi:3-hydroxyacyl-CoA dehydrogenase
MGLKIHKAAVLGSGVMGSQIAATLAAAGVRTYLLDLPQANLPEDPKQAALVKANPRSTRAILAIEHLKTMKPPALMSTDHVANLMPGNFEDDMAVLADVDWVIEAVAEQPKIKQEMIAKIKQYARKDIPITTNTSGLSIKKMCEHDEHFAKQFFGVHFFNPPRYMKLVEIIPHGLVDMNLVLGLTEWITQHLGKGIVFASDTINFIANRIGVFSIQTIMHYMDEFKLNVETVDALTGPLIGRPSSATFRTMDVVGIDVFAHVATNVYELVPDDPYRDRFKIPSWVKDLIDQKSLGQKSGAGVYKKIKSGAGSDIQVYRPLSKAYESQSPQSFASIDKVKKEPDIFKRLGAILQESDEGAKFLWAILRDMFSYAALLVDDIANGQPLALDSAMRWGFNWEWGPFQLWQGLGYDQILERMKAEGAKLPSWAKPGLTFYEPNPSSADWELSGPKSQFDLRKQQKTQVAASSHIFHLPKKQSDKDSRVVMSHPSVSLVDIGDGVAAFVIHSKMNAIDTQILEFGFKALDQVKKNFLGMVVGNEHGTAFSAGANLKDLLVNIDNKNFKAIDGMLQTFQAFNQMMKYASFPTVSAIHHLALGGGCEIGLHTAAQILAGEVYSGLVEAGVGLLPAGGGCKELAIRAYDLAAMGENADPMPFLQRAFMLIGMAKVSTSGFDAIQMGLYPQTAEVSLSADHLILRAKTKVQQMALGGYIPKIADRKIKVIGDPGVQTFKMMLYNMVQGGMISKYDGVIGESIATILCGGNVDGGELVSESYLLKLERDLFVDLCRNQQTRDRIDHMLKVGKPLRN